MLLEHRIVIGQESTKPDNKLADTTPILVEDTSAIVHSDMMKRPDTNIEGIVESIQKVSIGLDNDTCF